MAVLKSRRMFARSDVGRVRSNNEDQFLLERIGDWTVAAVADGMGGAAGGEVASWLAVDTVRSLVRQNAGRLPVREVLEDCLILAHERIRRRGETAFGNINMGTTLTLVVIPPQPDPSPLPGRQVFLGHVGDSRLYLVSREGIRQVTRDHTMTQHLLDSGVLTPETARDFRFRNVIYKSLGGSRELEPDPVETFDLPEGAVLLLCSDGLSNYLEPVELWQIIHHCRSLSAAGNLMVELARCRGGADNITVVLASPAGRPLFTAEKARIPADARRIRRARVQRSRTIRVLTALFLILAALLVAAWFRDG